jgi:hypothetical protein
MNASLEGFARIKVSHGRLSQESNTAISKKESGKLPKSAPVPKTYYTADSRAHAISRCGMPLAAWSPTHYPDGGNSESPKISLASPCLQISQQAQRRRDSPNRSTEALILKGPRPHRNDPKGFSYVSSYTEQRKKNEALHQELERAQARLQVKVEELHHEVARVEEIEQEGHSKAQHIQTLQQQVEGLEAREVQLVSAVQQLSKSGERALLALHQEQEEHETTSQRLDQLEISTHKTITEIKVVLKDQEQKLQQEQDAHEHEVKKLSHSLKETKTRAANSEREVEVLREAFREKQHALLEMAAEFHAQLSRKDEQMPELESKLHDSLHSGRSERVVLQSSIKDLKAQLKVVSYARTVQRERE